MNLVLALTLSSLLLHGISNADRSLTFTADPEPNPPQWPENVFFFQQTDDPIEKAKIQKTIYKVYAELGGDVPENNGHYSKSRYTFLFAPGTYNIDVPLGYYTAVYGLGQQPTDTFIQDVHVEPSSKDDGRAVTNNFWRGAEGFTTTPTKTFIGGIANTMKWAVSQATWLRRVDINGNLYFFDVLEGHIDAVWASGGYVSDTKVSGKVSVGSQQQFYFRNTEFGEWDRVGGVWNYVLTGPSGDVPKEHCSNANDQQPITIIEKTKIIAEKPYIVYEKENQKFSLFVPNIKKDAIGQTKDFNDGEHIDFSQVLVATAETNVNIINKALDDGKAIILCPGNYILDKPIHIKKKGAIILGLGFPTLISNSGNTLIKVDCGIDNIRIGSILFDAGSERPKEKELALFEFGDKTCQQTGNEEYSFLYDIIGRVGGFNNESEYQVSTTSMMDIYTNKVVIDQTWLWRADHAEFFRPIKNSDNPSDYGLRYYGNDGIGYGIFSEHHLKHCVEWLGDNGEIHFYQCEMPYDVNQENYGNKGYSCFNVNGNNFKGYGFGSYSFFRDYEVNVKCAIAYNEKEKNGLYMKNTVLRFLRGEGRVQHTINNVGNGVDDNNKLQYLCEYPPKYQLFS